MNYGNWLGRFASVEQAGISEEKTNPSQLGYSTYEPLARVKRISLNHAIPVSVLNSPDANMRIATPYNTVANIGNLTDSASQFASDLYSETKNLVSGSLLPGYPNWLLISGVIGVAVLFNLTSSGSRGRRRR